MSVSYTHLDVYKRQVGIEAAIEGDDFDSEPLLSEQGNRLFRGIRAGRVGIEIDDHVRRVPPENRHLLLGESLSLIHI